MKKRVISFLLSVVILFGMFFCAVPEVSAAYDMKASDKIVELIKEFEGFSDKPFLDNGQWSVGYGTAVEGQELAQYRANGITYAQADKLLRKYITEFEDDLNTFARKYSLKLSQQQFDALISFTYNLGPSWMNNDSTFRQAVISGETGNDFLFAISRWCTAGDTVLVSLIKRRLAEANIYLNGAYSISVPANYRYVIFNNNAENPVSNAVRVQGFDASYSDSIRSTPTKSGYRFLGWYTQASGGAWVSVLNTSVTVDTLHAHWQKGSGEKDEDGNVIGVAAKYQRTITAASSKIVRVSPSEGAKEKKRLEAGDRITIVADYMDNTGVKWGKLSGGGWINLHATVSDEKSEAMTVDPVKVTVVTDGVNIRSGPGTNYYKTGKFNKGEKLVITAVQKGGQYLWGKADKGWICLHYTDYDLIIVEKNEDASVVSANGIIVNTSTLNIRNGPGTKYEAIGKYRKGDQVKITLQKKVGSTTWGLTDKGWISLYYVELIPVTEQDTPDTTEPTKPTESEKTPDSEKTPEQSSDKPLAVGTVVNCSALNIRSAAGVQSARVGRLVKGARVEIFEKTMVKREAWGRTEKGWICLTYVKLDTPIVDETPSAGSESKPDTTAKSTGTVVKCSYLNVRSKAGVDNPRVAKLAKGTRVTVYETVKVNTSTWGRIDQGWVHMHYIQLEKTANPGADSSDVGSSGPGSSPGNTSGTSGSTKLTGTIVKTDKLRIRSAAGVKNPEVGTIAGGKKVTILETTQVGGTTWGRISKGWISLYYVQLDNQVQTSGTGYRTVSVSGLRIRSGPGTGNAVVSSYNKGTRVEILEETFVSGQAWGRTDKGWICLDYVR